MADAPWRQRISTVAAHVLGKWAADLRLGANQQQQQHPKHTFGAPPSGALHDGFSTAGTIAQQKLAIVVHPDVKSALQGGQGVVALESTIISHGMPYPQNIETARAVEEVVRGQGAVPATIAIIGGVPHVGLTEEQMEIIARSPDVMKTSRRDLPHVLAQGKNGATTVSATMMLAAAAGIRIFVTGGIGGVHRGGEVSMDVSADLTELGRTPVTVVCAGVKTILDIPRTLEFLETQGVTVAAYGADHFPAFYSPASSCLAPCRVDTPQEAAGLVAAAGSLGMQSGMVIGVPIPEESMEDGAAVEQAIRVALDEAAMKRISGNEVTPFLLKRVSELTQGKSLAANIKLIKNNAKVVRKIVTQQGRDVLGGLRIGR